MQLGRYQLIRHLASGGMADVYLARLNQVEGISKKLVVKRVLPHLGRDPEFISMFLDEARLASVLDHPNIAQIFEIGSADGTYFLVMEYLDGASLSSIMNARKKAHVGPLPTPIGCYITTQICAALHYAHEKCSSEGAPLNIVHRDVSPQNVMVTQLGSVKVLDFGIAKAEGRAVRTQTGLVKGKVAYMAPEQLRGEEVDRRADVFAVGILLYELMVGQRAYGIGSDYEIIARRMSQEWTPPSKLVPNFPPELEKIIHRATALDRRDRYASALELESSLSEFARSHGHFAGQRELQFFMEEFGQQSGFAPKTGATHPTAQVGNHSPPPPPFDLSSISIEVSGVQNPPPGPPPRRVQWKWPAAGLALLALTAGAVLFTRSGRPSDDSPVPSPSVVPEPVKAAPAAPVVAPPVAPIAAAPRNTSKPASKRGPSASKKEVKKPPSPAIAVAPVKGVEVAALTVEPVPVLPPTPKVPVEAPKPPPPPVETTPQEVAALPPPRRPAVLPPPSTTRAASTVEVKLDLQVTTGNLALSRSRSLVSQKVGAFSDCYKQNVPGSFVGGRARLKFDVTEDGYPMRLQAEVTGGLAPNVDLKECLVDNFRRLRFPSPDTGLASCRVEVSFE